MGAPNTRNELIGVFRRMIAAQGNFLTYPYDVWQNESERLTFELDDTIHAIRQQPGRFKPSDIRLACYMAAIRNAQRRLKTITTRAHKTNRRNQIQRVADELLARLDVSAE